MSPLFGKLRRDVAWVSLRQGHIRLALCVLFLPDGYELSLTKEKRRSS